MTNGKFLEILEFVSCRQLVNRLTPTFPKFNRLTWEILRQSEHAMKNAQFPREKRFDRMQPN